MPHSTTLIPSHLPAGTFVKIYTVSYSVRLAVIGLCLGSELTSGSLSDQICSKERSCYVGELVRLEFQVLVEAHDRCILCVILVSCRNGNRRSSTHIERYFVDKVHKIAKEHDRDNVTIDFVAQSRYLATSCIVVLMACCCC